MPGKKSYTGDAPLVHLTGGTLSAVALTFSVSEAGTGYPDGSQGPFVVCLARGTASEEKMLCSARSLSTFTVQAGGRGYDGTAASTHNAGETVEHVLDADTISEANDHVNTTTRDDHTQYLNTTRHDVTGRHGVGSVVPAGAGADISTSTPGDTVAAGATGKAADAGHRHARADAYGLVTDIAPSAPGDAAAAGTSTKDARADHKHAREDSTTVLHPVGIVLDFAGSVLPNGWLWCDGSAVSRTTYAALFAAIGTAHGAGDGSTTFNVPDTRGRMVVGAGAGPGLTVRSLGAKGGEETHALTTGELATHAHNITDPGHGHGVTDPGHHHVVTGGQHVITFSPSTITFHNTGNAGGDQPITFSDPQNAATGVSVNTATTGVGTATAGAGTGHNNMPPYVTLNQIIKS